MRAGPEWPDVLGRDFFERCNHGTVYSAFEMVQRNSFGGYYNEPFADRGLLNVMVRDSFYYLVPAFLLFSASVLPKSFVEIATDAGDSCCNRF